MQAKSSTTSKSATMNIFKKWAGQSMFWPEIIGTFFVLLLMGYFIYALCHESKTHPIVNKIVKTEGGYELSDTLLLCTQTYMPHREHFSVLSPDSTARLKPDDICIHCGKKLSEHHTEDVGLGKQITDSE